MDKNFIEVDSSIGKIIYKIKDEMIDGKRLFEVVYSGDGKPVVGHQIYQEMHKIEGLFKKNKARYVDKARVNQLVDYASKKTSIHPSGIIDVEW